MSQTTNALVLGKNTAFTGMTLKIYDPTDFVKDDFSYAKVSNGDVPKSFYVVYTARNYSRDGTGTSYLVPQNALSGTSDPITAGGFIRSAQGFDVSSPGLVLFEHVDYKGSGNKFVNSNKDINDSFPNGQVSGVSSAVVTGGKWRLYSGMNMQGGYIDVSVGSPLVRSFVDLGMNDVVQSIQRL